MEQLFEFANNHSLMVAGCIGLFLLAIFNELKIKEANLCGLSTVNAVKLINQNALLFDLRASEQFSTKHLLNSKNVEPTTITKNFLDEKNTKNKPVLLVCESGGVSKKTSLRLRSKGLENVFYIKGGQSEWEGAGLPTSSLSE